MKSKFEFESLLGRHRVDCARVTQSMITQQGIPTRVYCLWLYVDNCWLYNSRTYTTDLRLAVKVADELYRTYLPVGAIRTLTIYQGAASPYAHNVVYRRDNI